MIQIQIIPKYYDVTDTDNSNQSIILIQMIPKHYMIQIQIIPTHYHDTETDKSLAQNDTDNSQVIHDTNS